MITLSKSCTESEDYSIQSTSLLEWIDVPSLNSEDLKATTRLLKVPLGEGLHIQLDIATGARSVKNLTFVRTASQELLTRLLVFDFKNNPNIHNLENTNLIGNVPAYSTRTWSVEWRPSPAEVAQWKGWPNYCSLVEYDCDTNSFLELVSFSFWVAESSVNLKPKSKLSLLVSHGSSQDGFDTMQAVTPVRSEGDGMGYQLQFEMSPPLPQEAVRIQQLVNEEYMADGPLFRSSISEYEKSNSQIRHKIKSVLKSAESVVRLHREYKFERDNFMLALKDAAAANSSAFNVLQNVLNQFNLVQDLYAADMENVIAADLGKIYTNHIRKADMKKKEFEEESREWYNTQSRYLAKKDSSDSRKQAEKDSKYISKRKDWDLKRLDYMAFLQDLHGGRMEQQLLSIVMRFAVKQFDANEKAVNDVMKLKDELEALNLSVQEAERDFEAIKSGREERRRALEVSSSLSSCLVLSPELQQSSLPDVEPGMTPPFSGSEPSSGKRSGDRLSKLGIPISRVRGFKGSDQDSPSDGNCKKEGILYALSRPVSHNDPGFVSKLNWHKYWVTVNKNQLCEFSNWKSSMEIHNEPINLQTASVREARSGERRFCFEVITPSFTRIYQATSEEEVASWILAIQRSIEGSLADGSSASASKPIESLKEPRSLSKFFGLPKRNSSISRHPHSSGGNSIHFDSNGKLLSSSSIGESKQLPDVAAYLSPSPEAEKVLGLLKGYDKLNSICADCRKKDRVEWASINLGSLLCIDCAGLHRGLGSHVSKIRSIKLDTGTFTPEVISIFASLGNTKNHQIWEHKLMVQGYDLSKLEWHPNSLDSPTQSQRAGFIKAKYVDRKFISSIKMEPNQLIATSVLENDIINVYNAIAHSADINTSTATYSSLLEASLSKDLSFNENRFQVATFLLLNGANLISADSEAFERLDKSAQLYLQNVERRHKSLA